MIKMKKSKSITLAVIIALMLSFSGIQAQGPENPPGDPGAGDDPIGGGGSAPIGSGIVLLTLLGGAYALGRTYQLNHNRKK